MIKSDNGFTLIELLIVIAIIGVLAGILLVTVRPNEQMNKAKDAKSYAVVDGVRAKIENYFSYHNSFANAELSEDISSILDDYPDMSIKTSENKWAVKNKLTNGDYFCKDSSGHVSEKSNQDIDDYMCD